MERIIVGIDFGSLVEGLCELIDEVSGEIKKQTSPKKAAENHPCSDHAQIIIQNIKADRAELHDLNKFMASPDFLKESRENKDRFYDRNVLLTRRLQSWGMQIEALGFKLEPSDLE